MKKTALITGVTGQDGSYLAQYLLEKKYKVLGMIRRTSTINFSRIKHIQDKIEIVQGDLIDQLSLIEILKKYNVKEVYNLAAQSFVPTSWNQPVLTGEVTALGVTRVLEAIRLVDPKIKFYQASSSEMFGKVKESPQDENTRFHPRSPYGVSKVYGYWITINYRESYDIFGCNGILFNHESPRRGIEFVTRKITDGVARIKYGYSKQLRLGNLNAKRDWGYAGDYVRAMHLMLQQKKPDDYVISTGETHSVREFCEYAFKKAGYDIKWKGKGKKEKGVCKKSKKTLVVVDERYFRPAEVHLLKGDYSKAKKELKWKPEVSFKELVGMMVEHDLYRYEEMKKQGNKPRK
ncbi:GDP-mannose 4,6-dehydratase [Candidatus Woesearchaeota archaeon]|nr:GDP-mannose 4,6-dehydratase [Candidatus Woesearchaeota archaeon]